MFEERKKLSRSSKIALAIVDFIPAACLLMSIWGVTRGIVLTGNFVIGYLAVPCAVLLGNYWVLRSDKRKLVKVILCILLFLVLFFALLLSSIGRFFHKQSLLGEEALKYYEEFSENSEFSEFFPSIEELGEIKTMEYYNIYSSLLFFSTETDYVICQYDAEEYAKQKEKMDERYDFQQESIYAYDGIWCEPKVTLDGYHFRMLNVENTLNTINYPKYTTYVATNDETFEIIYMSVYDSELDYITSLEEFFDGECGWQYIR